MENHTTSLPKNEVSGCVASQSATRSARIYFPGEIRKVVQDGLVENMATIFRKVSSKNKVLCSGIFLNQETIVTVAHCVKEFAQNFTSIYIGISSSIEAVIKSPVTRVTVHPQFYSDYYGLYNDIAIVKFVPLQNAFRSTVCLPINSDAFEGSCKLISSTNDETKIIYVDLVGTTLCQDWIQENIADRSRKFKLYNSSICGLERKCEANKGGDGLYCQRNGVYYLTGLVSWGLNCNLPGVYTNIAYLENWIINNV